MTICGILCEERFSDLYLWMKNRENYLKMCPHFFTLRFGCRSLSVSIISIIIWLTQFTSKITVFYPTFYQNILNILWSNDTLEPKLSVLNMKYSHLFKKWIWIHMIRKLNEKCWCIWFSKNNNGFIQIMSGFLPI